MMSFQAGLVVLFVFFHFEVRAQTSSTIDKCRNNSKLFWCETGNDCIPSKFVCDGKKDCEYHEDELNCISHGTTYSGGMFLCHGTEKCIPKSLLCNKIHDCANGEDEFGCDTTFTAKIALANSSTGISITEKCKKNQFRCLKSLKAQCIPFVFLCDGENDCDDNSDELNCPAVYTECKENDVLCGLKCVNKKLICDGEGNCKNDFHGVSCVNNRSSCPINHFLCHKSPLKECINEEFVCNGRKSCELNEDEINCRINSTHFKRPYISCPGSPKCILKRDICNGFNDCGDNRDEIECIGISVFRRKCNAKEYMCPGVKECINLGFVCDGYKHCDNGEDEVNCPPKCDSFEFHCRGWDKCIKRKHVCDGKDDCRANEDEDNCVRQGVKANETNVSDTISKPFVGVFCKQKNCQGRRYYSKLNVMQWVVFTGLEAIGS